MHNDELFNGVDEVDFEELRPGGDDFDEGEGPLIDDPELFGNSGGYCVSPSVIF